jgi:hypothetical protein
VLPLLIRKYSQPEQIIKSENISAIVKDLNYFIHHSILKQSSDRTLFKETKP